MNVVMIPVSNLEQMDDNVQIRAGPMKVIINDKVVQMYVYKY